MTKVTDGPDNLERQQIEDLKKEYAAKEVAESKFPTEIIDLPSKGLLYPEGHPLSSGKIEMKYMTAKEEDILTSSNLLKQGLVIDKLLQSLIVTPIDYNDLVLGDKNAVMIAARVLGYGKEYKVNVKCEHCDEKNDCTIDLTEIPNISLDESIVTAGENIFNFNLPVSKRAVQFQIMTHRLESAIEEELKGLRKITNKTGISRDLTTRLKHLIVSVDGDTNKQVIRNFVDNELFAQDSRALREYIAKIQPDVDLRFDFACSECSENNDDISIPINIDFFWPGV